jgi:hypothetical protein
MGRLTMGSKLWWGGMASWTWSTTKYTMRLMERKNYWCQSLYKHLGRWKCKFACFGCAMGQYYMSIESQHVKNEHLFAIKGWKYVTDIVCVRGLVGAKKRKFLHFVAMFWLLKLSWPMTNFKRMKMLFHFLKVKNMPHKHYLIPWVGR